LELLQMSVHHHTEPRAAFERALAPQAQRAKQSKALWRMTAAERKRAMWAGELSFNQLREWSARRPHEVPLIGNEFAWIVISTADWIEARQAAREREARR
jgi:hypothetical protein